MTGARTQAWIRGLTIAAVVCFGLRMAADNKADVDLWGNVGFVKVWPWQEGYHRTNTFSYSQPEYRWTNHEWLAELVMYRIWRSGGNAALLAWKLAMGAAVLALMAAALRRDMPTGSLRFLMLLLMIAVMSYGFSTRPHHFTYLMIAVLLWLLRRARGQAGPLLIAAPVLGLAWANLHGAFFIGAVILAVAAMGETLALALRRDDAAAWHWPLTLTAALAAFIAASFVNPYGLSLWGFIGESAQVARPYLSEWSPFRWRAHAALHADFLVLAVWVGLSLAFARRRTDPAAGLLLGVSLAAALALRRNIPLFAIVAAFTAGPAVEAVAGPTVERLRRRIPAAVQAALLGALAVLSLVYAVRFDKDDPLTIEIRDGAQPLHAVSLLKTHAIGGNMLVFFDWAEYCIWHLWPESRVFMDGRFRSAYDAGTIDTYLRAIYGGPGWREALQAYPTDMALVHQGNPIAGLLLEEPGWTLALAVGNERLFLRDEVHADVLQRLAAGRLPLADPMPAVFP